jgi:PIN domain nuclease of toxin-antitoxin system
VNYLVDTHVLLYALLDPERLPDAVRSRLENPATNILVSAAVAWDIAIKESAGKLRFPGKAAVWLPPAIDEAGFNWLPIEPRHALGINAILRGGGAVLPPGDPFDRILAAQALDLHATLLCLDGRMTQYGVPVLWR